MRLRVRVRARWVVLVRARGVFCLPARIAYFAVFPLARALLVLGLVLAGTALYLVGAGHVKELYQ